MAVEDELLHLDMPLPPGHARLASSALQVWPPESKRSMNRPAAAPSAFTVVCTRRASSDTSHAFSMSVSPSLVMEASGVLNGSAVYVVSVEGCSQPLDREWRSHSWIRPYWPGNPHAILRRRRQEPQPRHLKPQRHALSHCFGKEAVASCSVTLDQLKGCRPGLGAPRSKSSPKSCRQRWSVTCQSRRPTWSRVHHDSIGSGQLSTTMTARILSGIHMKRLIGHELFVRRDFGIRRHSCLEGLEIEMRIRPCD